MSTKSLDSLAFGALPEVDQPVADLIEQEGDRQSRTFTLIASENYAPEAVLEASRSVFTNKYSEGYPGKR
jgi:glycine hydroxymethyltransferase